jgi:hypothetical protein
MVGGLGMGLGFAFTCRFNLAGMLEDKRDHVRITAVKRAKGAWWFEGTTGRLAMVMERMAQERQGPGQSDCEVLR